MDSHTSLRRHILIDIVRIRPKDRNECFEIICTAVCHGPVES